jgi:hypothetical protein
MASWDTQNEQNLDALPAYGTIPFVQAGRCVLIGSGHTPAQNAAVQAGNPQPGTMNKDVADSRFIVDQTGANRWEFEDNIGRLTGYQGWKIIYTR